MEAPDNRDRVRPLPPEGETGDGDAAPWLRSLLPMLVGGVALVAFIVVVSAGGGPTGAQEVAAPAPSTTIPSLVRPPDESTSTTTTTTTIPVPTTIVTREARLLSELLPAFTEGMNVVVLREDETLAVARWRADRRFPQFTELMGDPTASAALDASGTLVAGLEFRAPDGDAILRVGTVTLGTQPVFATVRSMAWADDVPGLMAIAARLPTEAAFGLFLLEFDVDTGTLETARRVADFDPDAYIAAYNDGRIAAWAVDDDEGHDEIIVLIDAATGGEIARAPGFILDTSSSNILGELWTDEKGGLFEPSSFDWDLNQLESAPDLIQDGPPPVLSPNGLHVAQLIPGPTSTITVRSRLLAGPRSRGVPGVVTSIVFFTNEHIAALADQEDKLYIFEWRTGLIVEFELEGIAVFDAAAPGYQPTPLTTSENAER